MLPLMFADLIARFRRGSTRRQPVSRADCDELLLRVVAMAPDGWTLTRSDGEPLTLVLSNTVQAHLLVFDQQELASAIQEGAEDAEYLWGGGVSATECAARLASVHIEECLARFETSPNRRWTYQGGGFRLLDAQR